MGGRGGGSRPSKKRLRLKTSDEEDYVPEEEEQGAGSRRGSSKGAGSSKGGTEAKNSTKPLEEFKRVKHQLRRAEVCLCVSFLHYSCPG